MLTRTNRRTFCYLVKKRDATKHFYMNTRVSSFSDSWAWVGRVMLPKALPVKSVNAQIETATVSALYSYFSSLNPSGTFDISNYDQDRFNSVGCLGIRFESLEDLQLMFDYLLENVNLPTHPLRHNLEKKERFFMHEFIMDDFTDRYLDLGEKPLGEFVEAYARYMENYIQNWTHFREEGVLGDVGNLDNKPDFMMERENQETLVQTAGNDLNHRTPENRTWVNSAMAYLHG